PAARPGRGNIRAHLHPQYHPHTASGRPRGHPAVCVSGNDSRSGHGPVRSRCDMRCLPRSCILALGLLVTAASLAAPSDVVDGPLIRPAVSSSESRDLSGVWYIRLYNRQLNSTLGRLPPFTARGKAAWDARVKAEQDGSPIADASSYCWPHGVPRVMNSPYPLQIIQTAGETVIVHEVAHNVRHIYMDQPHPQTLAA